MSGWVDILKGKLANLVGPKGHIEWSVWSSIWESVVIKEGLKHPPWLEIQLGADSEGRKFQKITFGLLEQLKPVLGKITLVNYSKPVKSLHLYKNNSEICSTTGREIEKFWSDLIKSSYSSIQSTLNPYLTVSRLKLVTDVQIEQEQRITQWIKASILTLKQALNRVNGAQDEFITARILMGKLPLQESLHIIIHCFNLEIVLMSTETKAWKLLAYDHKDGSGANVSSKPSINSLVEVQLSNIWLELDQLSKTILKI